MMQAFPSRAFDVGIAEQHAVTFSAGMATQGFTVFCAIYSTFLQRAYDQVIHDVALQKLPVVFCLDRAGLVGEDGATHHGVFDLAYLRCIPNMIIVAPANEKDLRNILYTAQLGLQFPIAIRYPRGRGTTVNWEVPFEKMEIGKGKCLQKGNKIAVLSVGSMTTNVKKAIETLNTENLGHYDMLFVKPLDEALLHQVFKEYEIILTVEDGVIAGGFGSAVLEFAAKNDYKQKIRVLGIPDEFIEQGNVGELQEIAKISVENIREEIASLFLNF